MADDKDKKLAELILHIARKSETDPRFGKTKLNKILFYAEFMAYGRYGKTITGQAYQKLAWGPAPRRLLPVTQQMISDGTLVFQKRDFGGHKQERAIALRDADLSSFSGVEIAQVDDVIQSLWNANGSEVSELSHRTCAWKYAEMNSDIPPESVFISDRQLTSDERRYAVELV